MRFARAVLSCVFVVAILAEAAPSDAIRQYLAPAIAARNRGDVLLAAREFQKAIEDARASEPLVLGQVLNAACAFYHEAAMYSQAESCLLRSLTTWRQVLGPEDIALNTIVNRLACIYVETGRRAKFDRLDLGVWLGRLEQTDSKSTDLFNMLGTLATYEMARERFEKAQELNQRALDLLSRRGELQSRNVVAVLNNMGMASIRMGAYDQAVLHLSRASEIGRKLDVEGELLMAPVYANLALSYERSRSYHDAERLLKQALEIVERFCGPDSPRTGRLLAGYASVLHHQNRKREAAELEKRARSISRESGVDLVAWHTVDIRDVEGDRPSGPQR